MFKWLKKSKGDYFVTCENYDIRITSSVNSVYWLKATRIRLQLSWSVTLLPSLPFTESVHQLLSHLSFPPQCPRGSSPGPHHLLSCLLFLQLWSRQKRDLRELSKRAGSTQQHLTPSTFLVLREGKGALSDLLQ